MRERKVNGNSKSGSNGHMTSTPRSLDKRKGQIGISVLDVLRIIGGLLLLNSLLSYFITNDSFLWGYRPWFVRPRAVMWWWVRLFPFQRHIPALTDLNAPYRKVPYD